MAPLAHWKGSLKLSLVSCPVALYPASTSIGKTRFT
jgi:DNA end-binding protein Ku